MVNEIDKAYKKMMRSDFKHTLKDPNYKKIFVKLGGDNQIRLTMEGNRLKVIER